MSWERSKAVGVSDVDMVGVRDTWTWEYEKCSL